MNGNGKQNEWERMQNEGRKGNGKEWELKKIIKYRPPPYPLPQGPHNRLESKMNGNQNEKEGTGSKMKELTGMGTGTGI